MPWGAIPEVPGGGCPERGIGCPMAPRPPIPPRDCPGPREGMPIPAAPAAGPPVRLCSAFIGSVGTQRHSISGRGPREAGEALKAVRGHGAPPSCCLQALLPQSPNWSESWKPPTGCPNCLSQPQGRAPCVFIIASGPCALLGREHVPPS